MILTGDYARIYAREREDPVAIAWEIDRIQQELTLYAAQVSRALEATELAKRTNPQTGKRPAS